MEYKKISKEELDEVLELHELWLMSERKEGECAYLNGVDLSEVDLSEVCLSNADLSEAYLIGVNLSGTNLSGANLTYADLCGANLSGCNLRYANLSGADLGGTNLSGANLGGCNLSGCNLRHADLNEVNVDCSTLFYNIQCPEEGSFIGYKKADNKLIILEITADSKRSSATSRKCRCSKAKVISIIDKNDNTYDEVKSTYDKNFIYKVGKIVEVEDFDENRWNECTSGIHFFIAKEEAWSY